MWQTMHLERLITVRLKGIVALSLDVHADVRHADVRHADVRRVASASLTAADLLVSRCLGFIDSALCRRCDVLPPAGSALPGGVADAAD
jgi:hypothetical protein